MIGPHETTRKDTSRLRQAPPNHCAGSLALVRAIMVRNSGLLSAEGLSLAMSQCSNCTYYEPLKSGDPPAGWCEFISRDAVPFWMDKNRAAIDRLGADVLATDGTNCRAFVLDERTHR